jgi:hypothetical protein
MARFDDDHLRCDEIQGAAVMEKKTEVSPGQESHMPMHTQVGVHQGLDMG